MKGGAFGRRAVKGVCGHGGQGRALLHAVRQVQCNAGHVDTAARQADRQRRMEEARVQEQQRKQEEQKKQTLREKQQAAQAAKAVKAAKAATSTTEAGRVGDRPYARGRAYKADRYDET